MTLNEFEQRYAERSNVTVEWLHAHGRRGAPCDCGESGCKGWRMEHVEPESREEDDNENYETIDIIDFGTVTDSADTVQ